MVTDEPETKADEDAESPATGTNDRTGNDGSGGKGTLMLLFSVEPDADADAAKMGNGEASDGVLGRDEAVERLGVAKTRALRALATASDVGRGRCVASEPV